MTWRVRLLAVGSLLALAPACGPHKAAHGPAPIGAIPHAGSAPWIDSDAVVETRTDGMAVVDRGHGLELRVPAGWTALTRFAADAGGPPPVGDLRVRLTSGGSAPCNVDVARLPAGEPTSASVAAGREVFFFARTDEPAPLLSSSGVWAATSIPRAEASTDVGYWIATPAALLRVEGRFPTERVPECKEALDAIVRSLSQMPVAGASAGAHAGG